LKKNIDRKRFLCILLFIASTLLAENLTKERYKMKNTITLKPTTVTVYISNFPRFAELKEAEAKKMRLQNSGYKLVRATLQEFAYSLPC